MSSCPYCLEEIKTGARKCPHCQSSLESEQSATQNTVYVVDKGLIKFAKFASAVLAIFVLVGLYIYAIDIKEASESIDESESNISSALLKIKEHEIVINGLVSSISTKLSLIEQMEKEIADHKSVSEKSARQSLEILETIKTIAGEARELRDDMRLTGGERQVADQQIEVREIPADRGKLWNIGSEVRYCFLDGEESYKTTVQDAIETWLQYANIDFVESCSGNAEVKVSFEQGGSWSYVGTDALGIEEDEPTINLEYVKFDPDSSYARQTALHEFGHVLGLVHEFSNPSAGELFDRDAVIQYFFGPPNHWPVSQIEAMFFGKEDYPGSRPYDPTSIMNLSVPESILLPGKAVKPGTTLSESDKSYISSLYPS